MENGLSNSSKRSLQISLRSPKRNLKKTLATDAPLLVFTQSITTHLTVISRHCLAASPAKDV